MRLRFALSLLLLVACGDGGPVHTPPPVAPLGSVKVTWRIVNDAGVARSCAEVGVDEAVVFVTGSPVTVRCGEEQVARFANLLAGNYPVTIQLKSLGGVLADEQGNVQVVSGEEAPVELVFVLNTTSTRLGRMLLRWRVNGLPALGECAAVGAETVRVATQEGSIASFNETVPCGAGEVLFENLTPGSYSLLLVLQDPQRNRIAATTLPRVVVEPGMEAMPAVLSFFTGPAARARLFTTWTVNATTATVGCAAAQADGVVVRAFDELEPLAAITASAACSLGQLVMEDLPPAVAGSRVVVQLYRGLFSEPPLPIVATTTVVRGVLFVRGETTTVSVDLSP